MFCSRNRQVFIPKPKNKSTASMNQRFLTVLIGVLLLIGGSTYYLYQKDQSALFDQAVMDAVHTPTIHPLFQEADAAKYAQDYQKADLVFQQLLNKPLSSVDSQYIYNQLAYINLAMNRDTIALQWLHRLEQSSLPFSEAIAADYQYNKGTWAYHTFQPKTAEKHLKQALITYQKIYGEQHLKTAMCLTQLGHLFYEFSDYPDSIFSYIPRAYDIFQTSPILKKHSGYNELGMVYINFIKRNSETGHYHSQNAIHLLSNAIFTDSITLARALSFKGQIIKKTADRTSDIASKKALYEEAEVNFVQAIASVEEHHPRYQEMVRNYLILTIFKQDSIGFSDNLNLLQKNVQQQGNYYAYPERLLGYYHFGNSNKTIDYYTQFLNKYAKDSLVGHALKTEAFYSLIDSYSDTLSTSYSHQEVIRYANAWITGDHKGLLDSTSSLQTLSLVNNSAMYAVVPMALAANAYWNKYLKYKKLSDLKETITVYKQADSLLFHTVNGLENNVLINFQKSIGNTLYPTALKAIFEYYNKTKDPASLEDAFHFSERMKSGILFRDIELLNKKDSIAILKGALDQLIGKSTIQQLNNYATTDKITFLNRQLEKLMLFKGKNSNLLQTSLRLTQQQLLPEQAIIQYNLNSEQSVLHALYFSKDTVQFYQYQSKDLKQQLSQYRQLIINYSNSTKEKIILSEVSYALYQQLLQPFEHDLHKRTDWVIIPDRNLHQIPFESLLTTKKFTNYKVAPYLISRPNLTISYAPSLKIFQLNSVKEDITINDKLLYFTYGKEVAEIPCAGEEIDSISAIFGEQATIYTDERCTKKQFLAAWNKDYNILHLSLHAQGETGGLFNNKIWFQPGKKDALYGFELTGTQASIKLVILSACETNVGNTDLGEGVYSMARYFFQSNTKAVIASLWQIEDCPNAQIMRFFYQQLRAGHQPKQALSEAKRLFLRESSDNLLAHPGFWAGLVCLD